MKFKKIIIFICILTICFVNISLADDETEDNIIVENEILEASADNTNEPETYSKHIICIERTTQTVLFEKDAYSKTAMASTTKILTGIIAIENCDLNEVVEISSKAANTGGSTLGISAGQKISMENLLYGLLLRSGNDTAVAIAEYIGGDLEGFAKIMNQKANEIGLKNSNFVTPHGLDDELHYTTAYDLAILTNYALNNETFYKVVSTKQISVNIGNYSRTLINTNELLGNVDGVYGVKTGFTGNAGRCLVSACKRNDLDIIVVVLGADTKKIRGLDSKKVIEYVFNNYQMVDTELQIKKTFDTYKSSFDIQTIKSNDKINLKYLEAKTYIFPVNKNKLSRLRTSIYCFSNILAPAEEGKIIGKIRLICDNNILYELNIVLNRRIERKTWNSYFIDFINGYKDCFKIIK
jgi:D-alanyl-D-alanine carboxypeptidase (penicillin-binding protein 5/6)